jgi:hypothetical protein
MCGAVRFRLSLEPFDLGPRYRCLLQLLGDEQQHLRLSNPIIRQLLDRTAIHDSRRIFSERELRTHIVQIQLSNRFNDRPNSARR